MPSNDFAALLLLLVVGAVHTTNASTFQQVACSDSACSMSCQAATFTQYACYQTTNGASARMWCSADSSTISMQMFMYSQNCTGYGGVHQEPLDTCIQVATGGFVEYLCGGGSSHRRDPPVVVDAAARPVKEQRLVQAERGFIVTVHGLVGARRNHREVVAYWHDRAANTLSLFVPLGTEEHHALLPRGGRCTGQRKCRVIEAESSSTQRDILSRTRRHLRLDLPPLEHSQKLLFELGSGVSVEVTRK